MLLNYRKLFFGMAVFMLSSSINAMDSKLYNDLIEDNFDYRSDYLMNDDAQNSNNLRGFSTTNNEINFFQEVKYSNKCRDLNNYNNYMLLTRIDIKKHQKNR